jgi:hypothetical protein
VDVLPASLTQPVLKEKMIWKKVHKCQDDFFHGYLFIK